MTFSPPRGAHALVQLGIVPDRIMHWSRWRIYNAARIYFEIDHYQPTIPATICVFNPDRSTSTMSPAEFPSCHCCLPSLCFFRLLYNRVPNNTHGVFCNFAAY